VPWLPGGMKPLLTDPDRSDSGRERGPDPKVAKARQPKAGFSLIAALRDRLNGFASTPKCPMIPVTNLPAYPDPKGGEARLGRMLDDALRRPAALTFAAHSTRAGRCSQTKIQSTAAISDDKIAANQPLAAWPSAWLPSAFA